MDVSVIIVSYNTKKITQNCLKSIYAQTMGIDFEVIVSDNGSRDGTIEMIQNDFPQVVLVQNNANIGFGAANNRGRKYAKGKYVFYLNSDTVLQNNAIKIFFDYWEYSVEKEKIGALGGILLDDEFQTIHSGAPFPTYKEFCKLVIKHLLFHTLRSVAYIFQLERMWHYIEGEKSERTLVKAGETQGDIVGADLFLLNNAYAEFDEAFFMYLEETDLELNMKEHGLKRFIIPGPQIQHLNKRIEGDIYVARFDEICIQNSAVYYSLKNFKSKAYFLRFLIWLDRLNPLVSRMSKKVLQRG